MIKLCSLCSYRSSTSEVSNPIYKAPPMPHLPDPQNRRIKTIVKHCTQTEEFDNEINTAICDGWMLDDVRPTSSESMVMLFALLHRYEESENHGKV